MQFICHFQLNPPVKAPLQFIFGQVACIQEAIRMKKARTVIPGGEKKMIFGERFPKTSMFHPHFPSYTSKYHLANLT